MSKRTIYGKLKPEVNPFNLLSENYFDELEDRSKKSKVYSPYQLIGLQLADLLSDEKHKSLYIKLAKKYNNEELLGLAKNIKENKNIKNKGAYFMSVFFKKNK